MAITMVPHANTSVTEDMNGQGYPVVSASSTATGTEPLLSVFVSPHQSSVVLMSLLCMCAVINAGLWLCVFVAMEIKSDVKTVPALLDQFYEKRRLLILSAPNISDPDYQLQNIMIQVRKLFAAADFTGSFLRKFIQ